MIPPPSASIRIRISTWTDQLAAGTHQFAPNEIAFFDGEHPTSAGHGVLAAFADATLTSDTVQFLDGTQSVIHAGHGDNFIFATPIDPTNPALNGNYTIDGGAGDDIIFAGSGNVTVHGGLGDDLIFAGSGNATLEVTPASTCWKPIRPAPTRLSEEPAATR